MIYGIGHDVVEIERIKDMFDRGIGEKLAQRILTTNELALAGMKKRPVEFLCGRFAAKEAVTKAFGYGIGKIIGLHDIEIFADSYGKPYIEICKPAWQRLELDSQQYQIHLSITHERHIASAFVVIEHKQQSI